MGQAAVAGAMTESPQVVVVGDGPTGLSAALFLAKNGVEVTVLGYGETAVHKALLRNYAGEADTAGPEWVARARGQAEGFGARLVKGWVERIEPGPPFRVATADAEFEGDHLVLATGFDQDLVGPLGLATSGAGLVRVDADGRTSQERVWAGGGLVRGPKTQVATSVGDGAAIALDILSQLRGKPVHDWDVLKPQQQAAGRAR